ncbi:MAG: 2,3,4,5-tetrahydropyridine-2,6-dicarboxylate N-succinyltransferase [Bdellovibrionales bacterium GWA2_49_15]|nr:MAG: 2,3,4,5-tetrahydropyridine-2,6-dicarboxylate N-succinyltransferase [Bdellovibrionales bacterium GWA2_49_15]HAZ14891.1 2,3,4,5-tetrahydropyridine-2,6-dicarboxylate N-succinyltransferase [Bdellovibrionales bacterium]
MSSDDFIEVLERLERGELRSAFFEEGEWRPNPHVKEAIIKAFRQGSLQQMGDYVDKHTLPIRQFRAEDGVRIVPSGSAVRRGSFIAKGVIIMPPSYINIGVYVDEGSMVDSHVLLGSCAQIGKRVHLSAGVQIGGVLEPIGQTPVVIEDDCFIGAGSVIVEGILVKKGAVIAPGVVLSRGTPVYDCVHEKILHPGHHIPEYAVVIPGTRPLDSLGSARPWAHKMGLAAQCALIVKYRDEKTNAGLTLENALR